MPGDGHTYCGDSCMCQFIPVEYAEGNESLKQPVNPFTAARQPQA